MRFIQTIHKNMINLSYFSINHTPVGISRAFIQDNKAHLAFMEIFPDFQRQGYGSHLISETENILRSQNVSQVSLLAQQPYSSSEVIDFYKKNGYVISNKQFDMYDDSTKMWDLVQMHKFLKPTRLNT